MSPSNNRCAPNYPWAFGVGVVASGAYATAMWIDLHVVRYQFDDLVLLGRPFSSNPYWSRRIGALLHTLNGGLLGLAYARLYPRLRGKGWCRGICFALGENMLLWLLMILVDRFHPARGEGSLAPAFAWPTYWVASIRHVAYGLAVGVLYRPCGSP